MGANYYEAGLRRALQGAIESSSIKDLGDSSPFFLQLMEGYPVRGSKIDWDNVPGSIEQVQDLVALQATDFLAFFDDVVSRFHLAGEVVYVGDSATDFALAGSLKSMREALPELLAVPQHHYLIGPASSWCMCFTMEGSMGFGFHPIGRGRH